MIFPFIKSETSGFLPRRFLTKIFKLLMLIRRLWGENREAGCKNSLIQSHNVRIMRQMRLLFTRETVSHPLVAAFGLSRLSLEFASPNRLNRQREKDGVRLQNLYWRNERELCRY